VLALLSFDLGRSSGGQHPKCLSRTKLQTFDPISAVFRKDGTDGALDAEIIVEGEVVESREVAAENGVVTVAYTLRADLFPG
jgi:hypothetical protein